MAEPILIEQIVEKAVARILESHIPSLREDLVRSVIAELGPELAKSSAHAGPHDSNGGTPADLLAAISAIHTGSTQKEILRALLDSTARYSGRAALFVIKSGIATGWQGRGFENSDAIKDFSLDLRNGAAAQAMQTRTVCAGTSADVDARFLTHFRAPANGEVIFLPLLLKDKIAALVYADAGMGSKGILDSAALELVVAATSAWLEVISLRKQAQKDGANEVAERTEPVAHSSSPSMPDPFAAHAPMHAPVARQSAVAEAIEEPAPMAMAASAATSSSVVTAAQPASPLSAADQDTHTKAQRFARLLIDEIKLYNQVPVIEGRKNHDLYDRLKEDIEKSRATYQKRYGSTAAGSGDYFNHELVRILAEGDASLLGVNYSH